MNRYWFSVLVLFSIFLIEACSSVPRYTTRRGNENSNVRYGNTEDLSSYSNNTVLETETGIASFYADKFDGKITYNGERYDMNGISAAHPSYPMGTVIRVTNLENDKSVILKINDKMPKRNDRIIDLSLGAARALDFVNKGLAQVKIDVLAWGQ